jgi:hypothetical protein
MAQHRPDNRPAEVVWYHFEQAFQERDFPDVSWALGSDWGFGSPILTAEQYRARAYERMAALYGPKPTMFNIDTAPIWKDPARYNAS